MRLYASRGRERSKSGPAKTSSSQSTPLMIVCAWMASTLPPPQFQGIVRLSRPMASSLSLNVRTRRVRLKTVATRNDRFFATQHQHITKSRTSIFCLIYNSMFAETLKCLWFEGKTKANTNHSSEKTISPSDSCARRRTQESPGVPCSWQLFQYCGPPRRPRTSF